ncbi:hypothetical protein K458DRAFT_303231 [Lentithecium fluviatile CBS 122367]|uniref:MARVEL domain-containing protein n=1 Tax=Lentithecium fluviatile CBS 122367 TaxID=1168545 RepID=A0A6G1J1G5_9PLEO|nr:hypothetical protein K458DRAFT_303231 [Lentithecium fluviatile CBS 122367]
MARRSANRPIDGPADDYYREEKPTGLLTRFVPDRLRHSGMYKWLLHLTRVFQFLSSVISLGIFSQRMYKVYRLVNSIKTRRGIAGSYGAVEGILAAAVLYTLIATLLGCIKKNSSPGPKWLRWLWVVLDILFVGAFIAVAVITSPSGGSAGPRHCYSATRSQEDQSNNVNGQTANANDDSCNLPWGTFLLAILSTLLHAITAAFHEVRDHHRKTKRAAAEEEMAMHGHAGVQPVAGNVRY